MPFFILLTLYHTGNQQNTILSQIFLRMAPDFDEQLIKDDETLAEKGFFYESEGLERVKNGEKC